MASLDPQTQIREGVFYFLTAGNTQFESPLRIDGGDTDELITVGANATTYQLTINNSVANTITQDKDGISFALPSKTLLTSTATGTVLNTPLTVTTYPATNTYFDIIPAATSTKIAQEGGTAIASITMNNDGTIQTSDILNVGVDASANLTVGPATNQALITPTTFGFQANGALTGGMKLESGVLKLGNDANVSSAPAISIDTNVNINKVLYANRLIQANGDVIATNGDIQSLKGNNLVILAGTSNGGSLGVAGSGTLNVTLGPNGAGITTDGGGNVAFGTQGDLTFTAAGNIILSASTVQINGSIIPTALVWAYSMGNDQYINMNTNPFSGTYVAWNNTIYENPQYTDRFLLSANNEWYAPLSGWYSITITLTGQAQDNTDYLSMEVVQVPGSGGGTTSSVGLLLYPWMAVYYNGKLSTVRGNQTQSGQFTKYLGAGQAIIVMGGQAGNNNSWQNALGISQMNIELLSA
jgi:hypothetical protein